MADNNIISMMFGSADDQDHSSGGSSVEAAVFVPPGMGHRSSSWSKDSIAGGKSSSGKSRRKKKYYTRPVFKEPGSKIGEVGSKNGVNDTEEKVEKKMPSHRMEIIHGLRNEVGKILNSESHVDTIQPSSRTKDRLRSIMMPPPHRFGLDKERNLNSRLLCQEKGKERSESATSMGRYPTLSRMQDGMNGGLFVDSYTSNQQGQNLNGWSVANSALESRDEDSEISISSEVFDRVKGTKRPNSIREVSNAQATESSYMQSKSVWSMCDCFF